MLEEAVLPPALLQREGPPPLWLEETLYFEGDDYYRSLVEAINGAKHLVTVEMYIFADDTVGWRIFRALEEAAARGVQVYMVLDAVGSHSFIQKLRSTAYHPNIRLKVHNPHPFTACSLAHLPGVGAGWGAFARRLKWINRRNHRKIVTVDERLAWMGSFNLTVSHSRQLSEGQHWHDIGLKLKGWVARLFVLNVMRYWGMRSYYRYLRGMPKKRVVTLGHPDIRLNQTLNLRRTLNHDFIRRLKDLKTRAWIIPGYFMPRTRVVRLLARAARKGVDVRILLSRRSDVFYFPLLQTYHIPFLLRAGVKIYYSGPRITHAKSYLLDDWVTVGSTNLNHRSVLHDLEVDVRVQHPDNVRRLHDHFLELTDKAEAITEEKLRKRAWWEKAAANLIFYFRYWN